MNPTARVVVFVIAVAGLGGGLLWWRQHRSPSSGAPPAAVAPAPDRSESTPPAARTPSPPPAEGIRHPVPPAETRAPGGLPTLDQADTAIGKALMELLGNKSVASFLRLDGFIRHVVATVDNLARDDAPAQMWPVNPPSGHFDTESPGDATVISDKNSARYLPLVQFAESLDTRRLVAVYVRFYPLFQQAYEELGYPNKYFNDRLVEVVDTLLATPDIAGPIKVTKIIVDGSTTPAGAQPLYVFADPALEHGLAGQKMLLRMGHENAVRMKAKLLEVRDHLIGAAPPVGTSADGRH